MSFTGSAICNSWKQEVLSGIHVHKASGGDVFKAALYGTTATLTKSTTVYTTSGELAATGGYSTAGNTLTNVDAVLSGDTAYLDFADVFWASATFTTFGALIYNSSKSNRAFLVLDFGGSKVISGGTFSIIFPLANASFAILRLT